MSEQRQDITLRPASVAQRGLAAATKPRGRQERAKPQRGVLSQPRPTAWVRVARSRSEPYRGGAMPACRRQGSPLHSSTSLTVPERSRREGSVRDRFGKPGRWPGLSWGGPPPEGSGPQGGPSGLCHSAGLCPGPDRTGQKKFAKKARIHELAMQSCPAGRGPNQTGSADLRFSGLRLVRDGSEQQAADHEDGGPR
jgi:hypothetical protein